MRGSTDAKKAGVYPLKNSEKHDHLVSKTSPVVTYSGHKVSFQESKGCMPSSLPFHQRPHPPVTLGKGGEVVVKHGHVPLVVGAVQLEPEPNLGREQTSQRQIHLHERDLHANTRACSSTKRGPVFGHAFSLYFIEPALRKKVVRFWENDWVEVRIVLSGRDNRLSAKIC